MSNGSREKKSSLFWINRVGFVSLFAFGLIADIVNGNLPMVRKSIWLGEVTNHVGNAVWGWDTFFAGVVAKKLFPEVKHIDTIVQAVGLATFALLEMTGVGNTADFLDLPALAIGFLGGLSAIHILDAKHKNRHSVTESAIF